MDAGKRLTKAGKRVGAPPKPQSVRVALLSKLEQGLSLKRACSHPDVDLAERTVYNWIDNDPDFLQQYTRAREIGYKALGDNLLDDAEAGTGDVQRDRLIVDTKKWMLSKMLPKIYGDRTTLDVKVDASDDLIKALAGR